MHFVLDECHFVFRSASLICSQCLLAMQCDNQNNVAMLIPLVKVMACSCSIK